jgi:RNA polymerase sigma-70 factor (ECF subfamily)
MTSDESLYERLVGGDMTAFDQLYRRYEGPLFGFINRYLADGAEAEEVFQEAFLALLRQRSEARELVSFRAWIYRVARNLCLNRLRSRNRAARALDTVAHSPPDEGDGPASVLARADTAEALARAVSRLPDHLAELYALRARGMSYEGVAEVLGIPIGTVKSRMSSMLRSLREEMSS